MDNSNYIPFEQYVFRTPILNFNKFISLLGHISSSDKKLNEIFSDSLIQEALYIASPELHDELLKFLKGDSQRIKDVERLKYSLLRYLSRMSTRCTPFGIFAGCSIGQFGNDSQITLQETQYYKRHTRLDMNYLCALAQDIAKLKEIKYKTKYYCNNSIYELGNEFRYVEYFYKGLRRIHRISAVEYSNYLLSIFDKAKNGATFLELANLLLDEDINIEESTAFIEELINNQLLLSEMEPTVTGDEYLNQLIKKLDNLKKDRTKDRIILKIAKKLKKVDNLLIAIDKQPIGSTLNLYNQLYSEVSGLGTKFEKKYLFQTDMIKPVMHAILSREIANEILFSLKFLNKITFPAANNNISKFCEAFYERYETREMPLMHVLDNESGIGYMQTENNGDINVLLEDLIFPNSSKTNNFSIQWNNFQSILLKKYLEAKCDKQYTLYLDNFDRHNENWDDLPNTISVMCQIVENNSKETIIYLKSAGGSSAVNLLGRFCHADKQIEQHVLNIIKKEEELSPDTIYAEIVHLPASRVGNILLRPVLRKYEIPYLSRSTVSKLQQIEVSDLLISVKKNKVMLRSKRLNKEIIPRLSSAHNYQFDALPVYHFLCDLQIQGGRGSLGFSWGTLANEFDWLPRVKYKNIILSPARWTIKQDIVKKMDTIKNDLDLIDYITNWRQSLQMPNYVVLDEGDNELFINLENALSIRSLFSIVKKKPYFYLEEFLFNPNNAIINSQEGIFTNEFIFSFYKEKNSKFFKQNVQ